MIEIWSHANCFDGMGAAWAAWKALGSDSDKVMYRFLAYGSPSPTDLAPKSEIIMLDFSMPKGQIEALLAEGHTVEVVDHHQTAMDDLGGWKVPGFSATFDLDHSGAYLASERFHPGERVPTMIRYLEDRDLWRFGLPSSREVSAYIASWPFEFVAYDATFDALEQDFNGVVAEGRAILRFQAQKVAQLCDSTTRLKKVGGVEVPVAMAPLFMSEVGEELLRRYPDAPYSAYYFDRSDGYRQWGLRSRKGETNVADIAKRAGGGGHPNAAGFQAFAPIQGDPVP